MPMPSIVWDYFDEFEGGGKCRLCGCIRNRKDKSTSTFWQHLERVHGLDKRQMLINSSTNNIPSGKMKPQPQSQPAPLITDTNVDNSHGLKRGDARVDMATEKVKVEAEPMEKMPKLELMTDLNRQATEETFKFISELVKQQSRPSLSPTAEIDNTNDTSNSKEKANEAPKNNNKISNGIISPIGISLNSLEERTIGNGFGIAASSSSAADGENADKDETIPTETKLASLNDYINGLLDISSLSPKNGTSSSSGSQSPSNFSLEKTKTPVKEGTPTKKRTDYLKWDEFFMGIAILSGQRSKDPHTQVGACIVKDNIIVGIGYNGMPNGCNDDQMPWAKRDTDPLNTKYPYVCHAEMNAILNKNCADIQNSTIYTTLFPCNECAKLIIQSRIKEVVYLKDKQAVEMNASRRLFDITNTKYSQFEAKRDAFTIPYK